MCHILMYQKHIKFKKEKLQIFYRLRNIFNCVLSHWRHLTAGLLYTDFVCSVSCKCHGLSEMMIVHLTSTTAEQR